MARQAGAANTEGVHVALLRGINLGGKNKLAMKDLAKLFEAEGCVDVRTYIQSGNVIFRCKAARVQSLATKLRARIEADHGLRVPVVLRSAEELSHAARNNPYLEQGVEPSLLHVAFLAEQPSAAAVAKLDPSRSLPDTFRALGRELYLCLPNGVARSKLTNDYFDRTLGTVSTLRNWRTVLTLCELAGVSASAA